jgi:transposase-like protein
MEDHDDFEFNYCPECGSSNLVWPWITAMSGKMRKCRDCGRTWHVIREFPYPGVAEEDAEPE